MDQRVEEVFTGASELPAEQRSAFLDTACGHDVELRKKVEALLAADDHAGSFMAGAVGFEDGDTVLTESMMTEVPGQHIGRYKLLSIIGEGGFGTVWMAEQKEPVRRRVALKVIKLGMDTKQVIARFDAERQALAMMDHPNIASVFDAGATETGRPYFVMELVRGTPIIEYCDAEKLDTRQRLELFVQVCHAIQHAHQKGVIHRDIKSSNVLIASHDDKPIVKVIDFGIAKATNASLTEMTLFTQRRQIIGTPAYMSPEQAEMSGMDIDTRSDVYSLGVLLYELLTGTTPFNEEELLGKGLAEMMRIIREVEPPKPSTRLLTLGQTAARTAELRHVSNSTKLSSLLRGDLDWIVMKCLEKERSRRYDTANGLALDVQRYLEGDPVVAAPPSAMYHARKFVRRNRAQVAAAIMIFAVLVLGIIGTSAGLVWALQEKSRADESASLARIATEQETEARRDAEANERRAIVEAERAEREAQRARVAEAEAQQRAEDVEKIAAFQASQLALLDAPLMGVRLRQSLVDSQHGFLKGRNAGEDEIAAAALMLDVALTGLNFTNIALQTLDENIFERALNAIEDEFIEQPLLRARLLQTLAITMRDLGLIERAAKPQAAALAIRRDQLGDSHPDTLTSIVNLGLLRRHQGDFEGAEKAFRQALSGRREVLGDDHVETIDVMNRLSVILSVMGRVEEANSLAIDVLDRYRRVLGDDARQTLTAMHNRGSMLQHMGRFPEAEQLYRAVLAGYRRLLGDDHPDTLHILHSLGSLFHHQNLLAEAEQFYREALAGRRHLLGNEHNATLITISNLGALLRAQGRFTEAEALLRESVENSSRIVGPNHPDTINAMNSLAVLYGTMGRLEEAESYQIRALEGMRRIYGEDDHRTIITTMNVAVMLGNMSRYEQAEPYYRQAVEMNLRVRGEEDPVTLISISNMGWLLQRLDRHEEAESLFRQALAVQRRVLGDDHAHTLVTMNNLASLRGTRDDPQEGLQLINEAVERAATVYGESHWQFGTFVGTKGNLLRIARRLGEAEEVLLRAHEIVINSLGPQHNQTVRIVTALVKLYEDWHEYEPSAEHAAKAEMWRNRLPGVRAISVQS